MTKKKNLSTKQDLCKQQVARILARHPNLSQQDAAFIVRTVCDITAKAVPFVSLIASNLNRKDGESKASFQGRRKDSAIKKVMQHIIALFGEFMADDEDFLKHSKKICREVGADIFAQHLFNEYILNVFYQEHGLADLIEYYCESSIIPKIEAARQVIEPAKEKDKKTKAILRALFPDEPGFHLVFVSRKSQIRPFLKAIDCEPFFFFDTSKASNTMGGSTVCYWGDRRNRKFDYMEVIRMKHAYANNCTRVFLFTSVGNARLEREFPSFSSISTVVGHKKLLLRVEKSQSGPLGAFPLN